MIGLIRSAITGKHKHPTVEDLQSIKYVAALSFGYRTKTKRKLIIPGPTNNRLAEISVKIGQEFNVPIFAQGEIADAIEATRRKVDLIRIDKQKVDGEYLDTGEVLQHIKTHLKKYPTPFKGLIVAHANHVDRVVAQATKIKLNVVPYTNLPRSFDRKDAQWWVRNRLLWALRETLAIIVFKLKGII